MIPKLRSDRTLPPGEHHATLMEVLSTFPATSPERKDLNQALQDAWPALQKLKVLAPDVVIYINGSYTTAKPDPNDVDLLFLTNLLTENRIIAFFHRECPVSAIAFDIRADPIGKTYLVRFFSATRSLRPKGIIVLDIYAHRGIRYERGDFSMRDTQPPITNEQEYQGYQAGLALLNAECVLRAQAVIESKDDPAQLQDALDALDRMNHKRQGIVAAIAEYAQRQKQSA